jgi:hypothetical protein
MIVATGRLEPEPERDWSSRAGAEALAAGNPRVLGGLRPCRRPRLDRADNRRPQRALDDPELAAGRLAVRIRRAVNPLDYSRIRLPMGQKRPMCREQ